ncbi:flagellar biosynthesis protein FlhA [Candidatus Liberibacter asiaticus]|uniref:Flagellar biosynthesis protein FlhA n=2 Tax=Liberibacter asiaticus TaxID=34021 RepID=C6XF33_LIBAP|nr:flagellar biosynthesis protein FlhA [Candidatus Liberibacter asiaticus]ACT56985.1 flagellar biosynthesis protein FlhA [Candidatus Liberibacter asiaticus str. psy62]AGH17049.1 flagellar biosynthesis protein FlhA [Candidatus Liberibacter asiaticus str. gxpsy]ALK07374.1 flagellar biosynthesis protein FlhA [Candidatus Liberibacter asiaticus]ASK52866.1 flagellar biosynthesis protein FlhA [Candidatus Liberibacter asiaticus]AWL14185.1 flagellar biosynthesis protein FlhA [Candidatus Liberibacter as
MIQSLIGISDSNDRNHLHDFAFSFCIVLIICILFLPIPTVLLDVGLASSIALSILILMVALWIEKPLEFSSFPTVLLIVTIIRLSLNIATTRAILSFGHEGYGAAGGIIAGFSSLVMSGDFVIGLVVFMILITINFIVITKGATRIAEVGARFTLDAIPGKQMAIDADLSSGLIEEEEAKRRRKELEEESAFFGAMDGASKFVRGDAIASIIITAINIVGGIVIGCFRYDMSIHHAADVFVRLSVGDGLVSQVPALIISLSAAFLVSRTTSKGSTNTAIVEQLSHYPRALLISAFFMIVLSVMPNLPAFPFIMLGGFFACAGFYVPYKNELQRLAKVAQIQEASKQNQHSAQLNFITSGVELVLGSLVSNRLLSSQEDLFLRVSKIRRKFAVQYGFIVPEIKVTTDISLPEKGYTIRVYGTTVAISELRVGEVLVILGSGQKPTFPGDEVKEPAFGMPAFAIMESFSDDLRRQGFHPIDNLAVVLTHLSEVIRNNLSQLLSYKDVKNLISRLDPEYQKLAEETCSSHISYSGIQAVLKLLLAEHVSIRNLPLILESIAEVAPHSRKTSHIVEQVRIRMAQQICGDLAPTGILNILKLGNHWDMIFYQAIQRDSKGECVDFNVEPRAVEMFSENATNSIRQYIDKGIPLTIVTLPEIRSYIRMILERNFPSLAVLSHMEIAKGLKVNILGTIS